ncbi:uncharacterized protein A1O9_07009 [Exophiala aquamarina CBS 119918]|uniref:Ubiquitin-like domain-containing protein n=1 Tax=Exophiala aquamarina CBS 119918 TaxID=1182545 RepID=A0A072P9P9_9EURO|nr:uncharacterized protein A1O9_07009 [Exophiala aquamarina CBS 119918]KEF56819.1 hypothetical protein A1O9_07009 [Exophiala aquamarina CBS 119918]
MEKDASIVASDVNPTLLLVRQDNSIPAFEGITPVRIRDLKGNHYDLTVDASDRIENLKAKIEVKSGILATNQKLILRG